MRSARLGISSAILAAGLLFLVACGQGTASLTSTASSKNAGYNLTLADLPVRLTSTPAQGWFTQQIDHPTHADAGTSALGTFQQQYWYDTEFASGPNAPVLFYLCGEAPCAFGYAYGVADSAKALGASIVVLEHRYYGQSLPYPDLTLAHMQYLTIHNALEDAAAFENWAKQNLPLPGKWIAVGGSYPGMLAAFFREKHPELVVGAWASSAPVNVVLSFTGYDAVSADALGPQCDALMLTALGQAQTEFLDPSQRDVLAQELWGVGATAGSSEADFLDWISNGVFGLTQYGSEQNFCRALEQDASNPLEGIIEYYNPPLAPDPVMDGGTDAGLDGGTDGGVFGTDGGIALGGSDAGAGPAVSIHVPFMPPLRAPATLDNFLGSEWFYQVCTEVGFYQVANTDRTLSVESSLINEQYFNAACKQYVGKTPHVAATNETYYAPLRDGKVSNVLFVTGSLDPWSVLSFNDPTNMPTGLTGIAVAGGSHCEDLEDLETTSALGVFQAHKLFYDQAQLWLVQ